MGGKGFTLVELLVALAVLAIVSAVAMPIYTQYSIRTYRAEAQADLLNCGQGMERHASMDFTYANAVDADGDILESICTPRSTNYAVTVEAADADGFTLRATPTGGPVADDGMMEIDAAGRRRWDEDDDGNFGANEDDWTDDG